MRVDGETQMSLVGKLAVFAFLFLLTGLAVTWANPTTGVGTTTQLTQDQQKLCMNCHSPRDLPNDTSHVHTGQGAMMQPGAPCWVCHGDTEDPNGDPTHNPDNLYHPTAQEAAAVGKDILNCTSCHYPHDIIAELASGSLTPPPPSNGSTVSSGVGLIAPSITIWAPMIGAGVSLITGISMIAVLFSVRRRGVAKGGS
jgi:hypothetical protein